MKDGVSRRSSLRSIQALEAEAPNKPFRSLNVRGFILGESRHPPTSILPPHFHELTTISFALKGSCEERLGQLVQERKPYDLLITPAGEVHSIRYGRRGARVLRIEIEPHRLETTSSFSEIYTRPTHAEGAVLSALAIRLYKEFRIMDNVSALAIEGLVLEILAHTMRYCAEGAGPKPPGWFKQAKEFLHEHFYERLTLAQMAEAVGVHPVYLARAFRHYQHCTVGDYVRRLRIEFASRELIATNHPLADIALAAGFSAQSHFSSTFKRQTGLTPAQYRAAHRSS
jgi:AraC family transcriptional regulator